MTSEELLCDANAYDYAGDEMKGVLRKLEGEDVSFAVALQPRMVREWSSCFWVQNPKSELSCVQCCTWKCPRRDSLVPESWFVGTC